MYAQKWCKEFLNTGAKDPDKMCLGSCSPRKILKFSRSKMASVMFSVSNNHNNYSIWYLHVTSTIYYTILYKWVLKTKLTLSLPVRPKSPCLHCLTPDNFTCQVKAFSNGTARIFFFFLGGGIGYVVKQWWHICRAGLGFRNKKGKASFTLN